MIFFMNQKPENASLFPSIVFSLLFSVLCFITPCKLLAQNNIETTPYIEVIGSAQIVVIPDEINLQIILKEYYDGGFKITVAEQEAKMKNMLKIAGIEISKLSLAKPNDDYVTIVKMNKSNTDEKRYSLTVSTVSMLVGALQVFNDLSIKDVKIISVSHSNIGGLMQEVKIKAIQDAKEKAKSLVSALGNRLGKTLIIKEDNYFPKEENEVIKEDEFGIEFKKIILKSNIYARFAIE